MTQRTKRGLKVWGILSVLFGLLYIVAHIILVTSFTYLEEDSTLRNMQRVLNTLSNEIEDLSITTSDWAAWDDTYEFIQDHNEAYITSNLVDDTLLSLQLNLMLFVDANGQVVFERVLDLENGEAIPLEHDLAEHLTTEGLLLHNAELPSNLGGFIQLPQHTLLVAAYPILNSADEGPSQGTAIFGRIVDSHWINQLADSIQLSLTLETWNNPTLPPDFQRIQSKVEDSSEIVVQPLDRDIVAGYGVINDIYDEPTLFARVDIPRQIYQQGQTTLAYFGGALVIIGILFGCIALILLEKNRLANEQFEIIINNSNDAICLVRSNGTIVQKNPAFNTMFVSSSNDFQYQLKDVFGTGPNNRIIVAFNEVMKSKVSSRLDAITQDSSNHQSNVDVLLSPVLGVDNRISGVVCSFHDITAQKQTEEQLRKALAHETELGKIKAQFVSMASHELRTPLTEIKLAQEFLLHYSDRLDDVKKKQKLDRIGSSIDHMQNLLEDVLTLSRVESDQFDFVPEKLNVEQYCRYLAKNMVETNGGSRTITVTTVGEFKKARLDQKLVRHIIDNLLSNALKYSDVNTTVYFDIDDDDKEAVFTVRDAGMGISTQEQSQIFDMFFRGKTVVNIPGTGLGLAIVKQSIDAHHGTISVESIEGEGTTVIVKLPYESREE